MLFLEDQKPICHERENPPLEFIPWGRLGKLGMPGQGWEGWWQQQDVLCHCWPWSQRSSHGTAEAESLNSPLAAQQGFAK